MESLDFARITPYRWRLPRASDRRMKTDAEIFASDELLAAAAADDSLRQVVSVATLPGIVGPAL
ncbi:MAG TPA: RNA-splicing ligase RtcB, partial [Candidatus Aminicenantes bacterium]|nr:RNA-splicing ligase RtcB [Candidatus Aminicenantes bacterium]